MLDIIAVYPLAGSLLSASTGAVRSTLWAVLLLVLYVAGSQASPYTPTAILLPQCGPLPCQNQSSDVAYIISPGDSSVDLLSIDLSSTLRASSPNLDTLTSGLPFLDGHDSATFTASISEDGIITVLAGECSLSGSASVWTYDPASSKSEWTKHKTDSNGLRAPSFLGGSLSFSATIAPEVSPPITYVYGGMCPWSNATASMWQSTASYSNQMLKVSSQNSGSDATYTVEYAPNNGPPIAEAGFSFTTLPPSIANRSGIVTQQVNHVLLGGHTRGAFINMSTAGLWSLPEESWGFISINGPSSNVNTELAIKDLPTSVDSRSGHTTVLNEDGSALIVLGGWVGDLTQAAMPQLAIVDISDGFDEWRWSIPTAQPSGLGIYGHGAVLLPGNVMMVYGGYSISSASESKARKRQVGGKDEVPMFLNLTSMTWTNDYTNPVGIEGNSATLAGGGNPKSKQIGLGVGLGLGIPLLIAAVVLALWCMRHRRRERDFRDEVVRNLSQDAARFMQRNTENDEMLEREHENGMFPWNATSARDWYTGGHDPYVRGQRSLGYESLRTTPRSSLSSYPPPPPAAASSGTGRLRAARGLYQPTTVVTTGGTSYEFGPLRSPAGGIEPIYEEADEDEEVENNNNNKTPADREVVVADAPRGSGRGGESPTNNAETDDSNSDPFLTPANATPRGSGIFTPPSRAGSTPSPDGSARPQDPEVRDWVTDVDAADAVLAARIGPHGTTTTMATTLVGGDDARTASNLSESTRSTFSAVHQSGGAMSRSGSVRSHFRGGSAATATEARLGSSSGSSSHTWGTAKSNLAGLRDEGPGLLLGSTVVGGDNDDEDEDQTSIPGSPSKYKNRRSWLGSLRRVFSGGGGGSTSSSSRADSPAHESLMEGSCSDYEPRLVGMGPGGQLLRRKQGREAWEGEEGGGQEDDWDVERAVEQRLVQIMFTVPKERLRVVNAEIEKEEEVMLVDPEKEDGYDEGKEKATEEEEQQEKEENRATTTFDEKHTDNALPAEPQTPVRKDRESQLLEQPVSTKADSITSLTSVHLAEAVKLERPRTRVLEMVESIESLSRNGSPASSPER